MRRSLWVGLTLIIILAVGAYFVGRHLSKPEPKKITSQPQSKGGGITLHDAVVVVGQNKMPTWKVPDSGNKTKAANVSQRCREDSQYKTHRRDLGILINRRDRGAGQYKKLAKAIDNFRNLKGIFVPLGINQEAAKSQDWVFSQCLTLCRKNVRQVMVKDARGGRLQILTKKGRHIAGGDNVQTALVDELNNKGLPFRSWKVPMVDGRFFVKGVYLYYALDIPMLWLRMSPKGSWNVVKMESGAKELKEVKKPLEVNGCSLEENCFKAGNRRFKSTKVCS